ncbi:MAG: hypothetical protein AB7P00_43195, partial [Sandaracinaceae bacterium]
AEPIAEPDAGPAGDAAARIDAGALAVEACALSDDAPLVLLHGSVGAEDNLRFLTDDCAAEVVVGAKRDAGPSSVMRRPDTRARGGRSGYVMDLNGRRIRDALLRDDGVARTASELRAILANGYDYIVIDEITAAADWVDGALVNRRFRRLLEVLPPRTVIAYVSLDLTMASDDGAAMRARRQLLYALMQHGRALALEVYLHTDQVRAGLAPDTLRRAAIRLREAVLGLPDGGHINRRAITVLGVSINAPYAQYRYLDRPAHDLASLRAQALAARTYGALLQEQRGLGYYFVNRSDIEPLAGAPYDLDQLIGVMAAEGERAARASAP